MSLNKVIQRIEIEMSGSTKQYMVSAKQGDRATRYVEVALLDHGSEYQIPDGSSVTAFIRKPDRHKVYTPCDFTGNAVMVELDSQALAAAGTALCEVEVKSSDLEQVVTSVTFEIEIEEKVKDEDAIISGDELSIFDKTMKQYAEAETKRVSAEEARVKAEDARVTAENSRVKAEKDRVTAENGRVSAEKDRVTAENGRVSAEKDRVTAENARQQAAQQALDAANEAVKIAGQVNEASYMEDKDKNVKYAYAIYTKRGVPHLALTEITT